MGIALMGNGSIVCPFAVGMWCFYDGTEDLSTIYPGTKWQKMEGRFLFGSNGTHTVGTTGGEENHKLIESELPRIDGAFATAVLQRHAEVGVSGHAYGVDLTNTTPSQFRSAWSSAMATSSSQYGYGYGFGGDQSHNNMPPYYVTNMWKRIA